MNILIAAAENDALPDGKVGGIGDVIRDVPPALAAAGHSVHVLTPGYQAFSKATGAKHVTNLQVRFRGAQETVSIFKVQAMNPHQNVTLWVVEHPLFAAGGVGKIYSEDPPNRPFATDASKFALFSAAVATSVISNIFGSIEVLHLHDWHSAMVAMLRAFDPLYKSLQPIHTVYTIHNLSLQGVRPLAGDLSSLQSWFPDLQYDPVQLNDPRAPHCINPMRIGIKLSDKVHAVSPSYAKEIQLASNLEQGYFGGEGLELDLQSAAAEGRLHGILNGCEYPEQSLKTLPIFELLSSCESELLKWIANKPQVESAALVAISRITQLMRTLDSTVNSQSILVTSVGRITEQKILLLQQRMASGESAIDQLLTVLGHSGLFIMTGSGDHELEQFLTRVAARHKNFIFLKGYSDRISDLLYDNGDLFLMPSSFEPCGISQMLAMRRGQACLVHSVGGLKDTVINNKNGFCFNGNSLQIQAKNMILCFEQALHTKQNNPKKWQAIARAAANSRFPWSEVAADYLRLLYSK